MANPSLAFGALAKPSRFGREVDKFKRQQAKRAEKRADRKAEQDAWALVRAAVYRRDCGRCRVCTRKVRLVSDSPLALAHTHHVIYRSAQGSDELWNLACLCGTCHDAEHRHEIAISGRGDAALTITQHNQETGKVLRTWDSPCPTVDARRA